MSKGRFRIRATSLEVEAPGFSMRVATLEVDGEIAPEAMPAGELPEPDPAKAPRALPAKL